MLARMRNVWLDAKGLLSINCLKAEKSGCRRSARIGEEIKVEQVRTEVGKRNSFYAATREWNELAKNIRDLNTWDEFKRRIFQEFGST